MLSPSSGAQIILDAWRVTSVSEPRCTTHTQNMDAKDEEDDEEMDLVQPQENLRAALKAAAKLSGEAMFKMLLKLLDADTPASAECRRSLFSHFNLMTQDARDDADVLDISKLREDVLAFAGLMALRLQSFAQVM